jgi:hypothetical protein
MNGADAIPVLPGIHSNGNGENSYAVRISVRHECGL